MCPGTSALGLHCYRSTCSSLLTALLDVERQSLPIPGRLWVSQWPSLCLLSWSLSCWRPSYSLASVRHVASTLQLTLGNNPFTSGARLKLVPYNGKT